MNSELFTRQRSTTEHLEQTGASTGDSIQILCHSSKSIWSLLRTMSIARDSFDIYPEINEKMSLSAEASLLMGYIQGEGRIQGTLFPAVLEDLVPADHMCRVIDAFVETLVMSELGFERAQAAETGRPGYNPRDLLKLYLYGYLNQIRSSRRLEAECRPNVELMWLLERVYPDPTTIAEFRPEPRDTITSAGAELVRFARNCGPSRGEGLSFDGSKFSA